VVSLTTYHYLPVVSLTTYHYLPVVENHRTVAVDFEFDIGSWEGVLDTIFVLKFVYKIQKVFVFSIYEKKV
jgi:hypothetical protein